MRTAAILPAKSFAQAKRRLRLELADNDRRALVEAMFADALVALGRVLALERVIVVSADHVAQRIAAGYGANVVEDDERGHNSAATRGIRFALEQGIERALLVPGDCPMLTPRDIEALLAHSSGERSALIVPDRHGTGTNALVLTPPAVFTPSFGPGSCQRHVETARAAQATAEVVVVPSLATDVDTPEDLETLEVSLRSIDPGIATATRRTLGRLMLPSRC